MGDVRRTSLFVATILAFLLNGCTTQLALTYVSDPPGAMVYQDQQILGYAPKTLYYKVREEDKKRGQITLQGISVQWASGATAIATSIVADLSKGLSQQFTFIRPANVAGREADVQFALELERLRLAQQQVDAQRAALGWQQYQNSMNQLNQVNQQIYQQPQNLPMQNLPINCISSPVGNTIVTNCR